MSKLVSICNCSLKRVYYNSKRNKSLRLQGKRPKSHTNMANKLIRMLSFQATNMMIDSKYLEKSILVHQMYFTWLLGTKIYLMGLNLQKDQRKDTIEDFMMMS